MSKKKEVIISQKQIMDAVSGYMQFFGEKDWGLEKDQPYKTEFRISDTVELAFIPDLSKPKEPK